MPDGTIAPGRQWPSAFVHPDGTRLSASMLRTGSFVALTPTDEGTRMRSLRLFASVEVVAKADGHFPEPAVATLTGASRAQVTMLPGAEVEILAVDAVPLRSMALVHRATGERVRSKYAELEEGRPRYWFVGLRPGDYDLRIDRMVASPSFVHVPAGSTQSVLVVLTEK